MRPDIYWIDHPAGHRLGIMARPRAGDWLADEIAGWRSDGVDCVVSLLEAEEVSELGLRDEARLCEEAGIAFLNFPIVDRGVPGDAGEVRGLAARLHGLGSASKAVAIHCRAGIGRSSVIAGTVLAMAGVAAEDALEAIRRARGVQVPDTDQQREWLIAFTAA